MTPPDQPYGVDWAHRQHAVGEIIAELSARASVRRKRRRRILVSGCAMVCVAAGLFLTLRPDPTVPTPSGTAIVSVPVRQTLPDGTLVELKDGAKYAVDFTGEFRRILLTAGEAHFQVTKDASRPFIVTAGSVSVRAVGTAFSVQLGASDVEVVVSEGRVAVRSGPSEAPSLPSDTPPELPSEIFLTAGDRVMIPATALAPPSIETLDTAQLSERLSWRVPKLEFTGTPLSEAIAMFNAHNETKFVLADDSLGSLQISGFLRADKSETFVLLLETDFGLTAERRGSQVHLRR